MQYWSIIVAVVFLFAAKFCEAAESDSRYTPPGFARDVHAQTHYENWLAESLRLFDEQSIWSRFVGDPKTHTYRITKVPSFSTPTVVRLEVLPNGSAEFHIFDPDVQKLENLAKRGASRDILLTELKKKNLLRLGAEQVSSFEVLFQQSGFWTDKIDQIERRDAKANFGILDGTTYFIEASFSGRFKLIQRHGCWMEDNLKTIIMQAAKLGDIEMLADGCD